MVTVQGFRRYRGSRVHGFKVMKYCLSENHPISVIPAFFQPESTFFKQFEGGIQFVKRFYWIFIIVEYLHLQDFQKRF
jgi:hypothetical protein